MKKQKGMAMPITIFTLALLAVVVFSISRISVLESEKINNLIERVDPYTIEQNTGNNILNDAIQTFGKKGKLKFEWGAYIKNNPDNIIATQNMKPKVKEQIKRSFPVTCRKIGGISGNNDYADFSGAGLQEWSLPNFINSTSPKNIFIGWNESVALPLTEGSYFNNINLHSSSSLEFLERPDTTEYFIRRLDIGWESTVTMAPGDYWIEELTLNSSSRMNISGSGMVRIFVKNLNMYWDSKINYGNDVEKMLLISYDDAYLNSDSKFTGVLYAKDKVIMGYNSEVKGAVMAKDVTLNNEAHIVYDPDVLNVDLSLQ